MKYRAVVIENPDPSDKARQIVGNHIDPIVKWAEDKAAELPPSARVVIYMVTETAICTRQGTKE